MLWNRSGALFKKRHNRLYRVAVSKVKTINKSKLTSGIINPSQTHEKTPFQAKPSLHRLIVDIIIIIRPSHSLHHLLKSLHLLRRNPSPPSSLQMVPANIHSSLLHRAS